MKKLLLLALLAGSLQADAQRKGGWLNIQTGFGVSALRNHEFGSAPGVEVKSQPSFSFAAQIGYMFDDYAGIFTGLGFTRYGWMLEESYLDQKVSLESKQHYVQLPVFLQIQTSKAGKPGAYGQLGVNLSFITNAKWELALTDNGSTITGSEKSTSLVRDPQVFIFIGAGVDYPVSERFSFRAGLAFDYSATKNLKEYAGIKGNLSSLTGKVGVTFRLSNGSGKNTNVQ